MSDKMSDSNQKNPYDVPLVDHEYDGIQELNNPAPFWWQLFFYLSIVFGIGYYAYYELGAAPSSNRRLQEDMAEVYALQSANKPAGPDEAALNALVANPNALQLGKTVYDGKCMACHATDGGGLVGPNLADSYWIHGKGDLVGIYKVIHDGVADKGMPAWGTILKAEEVNAVTAYVKQFQGKKVAAAKAPQGVEIK
jgi:cytochrome c oxidase cbb3-type subunit III